MNLSNPALTIEIIRLKREKRAKTRSLEALDYCIQAYKAQLESDTLDEDTASEIENDAFYLETIMKTAN